MHVFSIKSSRFTTFHARTYQLAKIKLNTKLQYKAKDLYRDKIHLSTLLRIIFPRQTQLHNRAFEGSTLMTCHKDFGDCNIVIRNCPS